MFYLPNRSRSKEKDTVDPVSEKKKVKEEKEDEKVEDVSVLDVHQVMKQQGEKNNITDVCFVLFCSKTLTRTSWRRR